MSRNQKAKLLKTINKLDSKVDVMPLGVVEHSRVSALREAKAADPWPGTKHPVLKRLFLNLNKNCKGHQKIKRRAGGGESRVRGIAVRGDFLRYKLAKCSLWALFGDLT